MSEDPAEYKVNCPECGTVLPLAKLVAELPVSVMAGEYAVQLCLRLLVAFEDGTWAGQELRDLTRRLKGRSLQDLAFEDGCSRQAVSQRISVLQRRHPEAAVLIEIANRKAQ